MDSWTGILTDISWFGPFGAVAIVKLVEIMFPRVLQQPAMRPANITFGVMALAVSLFASYVLAEPAILLAYALNVISIAEFPIPPVAQILTGLLVLDLLMYANHVLLHRFDALWRLHRVHHADRFVTASSGLLHHPIEVIWNFMVTLFVSVMLGIPVGAILIFGAINAVHAAFSHGSFRYPAVLDRVIGSVFIMPDIHRIHHSVDPAEWNANYGQILSIWDRLFRTFIATSARGNADLQTGTDAIGEEGQALIPLLKSPFA